MTNLTNSGKIIKTNKKVKGIYGKAEHLWILKRDTDEQQNLFARI